MVRFVCGRLAAVIGLAAAALCGPAFLLPASAVEPIKPGDVFGDWVYECPVSSEGQPVCALNQTILLQQTGQPVVRFGLARHQQTRELLLMAFLPQGLDLTANVFGAIDEEPPVIFTMETCIAQMCLATHRIDAAMLRAMKRGSALKVSFQLRGRPDPVHISGSLKGITAGVRAAGLE